MSTELARSLRGRAFPAAGAVSYPRADPSDRDRLPADTWRAARIPVGVRLELVGDADAIDLDYETATDDLGARGPGGGTTFTVYRDGTKVDEQRAELGRGRVRLSLGSGTGRVIVHIPEWMHPTLHGLSAIRGDVAPAPHQPRWVCYGDSIAEGWVVSEPALAWPALAGRAEGLDTVNLGYDGAARGEIVSAMHLGRLDADVISLHHGSNCWTRVPHSADMLEAGTTAFLTLVRAAHPTTPIVVTSPIVRPEAEDTPNELGATLGDLRMAMEHAVVKLGDPHVTLVPGAALLDATHLADGLHPGDEGHRVLAAAIGPVVADALSSEQTQKESAAHRRGEDPDG